FDDRRPHLQIQGAMGRRTAPGHLAISPSRRAAWRPAAGEPALSADDSIVAETAGAGDAIFWAEHRARDSMSSRLGMFALAWWVTSGMMKIEVIPCRPKCL